NAATAAKATKDTKDSTTAPKADKSDDKKPGKDKAKEQTKASKATPEQKIATAKADIDEFKKSKGSPTELAEKLKGLTVEQIKGLAREHGSKLSGNKADLAKRLAEK